MRHSSFVKNMLTKNATTSPTIARNSRVRSSSRCSMNDIRSMPSSSSSSSSSSSGGGGGGGFGGGVLTSTEGAGGSGAITERELSVGAVSITAGSCLTSLISTMRDGSPADDGC